MPALHGFVSRVVFCTARHRTWQAKNPHCTELHGPAGKATMHGFTRKMCKSIPNFTDLHGTAWKVPVHMDPNLSLLMELNSYESQSVTAYGAPSRPCQITGHGFHGTTLPMASIEPHCTDLHGPPRARICTDLPIFDDAQKTCNRILKCTASYGFHATALSFSRGCTSLHGTFLIYIKGVLLKSLR